MRKGFTLLELLVSIALVLILILGVNEVFRIATTSIGAGNAISDTSRDNRAIQTVIANDFQNAIIRSGDMPAFIIRSSVTTAFKNKADALSSRSYLALYTPPAPPDPTLGTVETAIRKIDLDGNNIEGEATVTGEVIPRNQLGERNFRQDTMSFFARYRYPRQTGNDGAIVSNMGSNEAWIWWGHLRQPKDANITLTVNKNPGTNPFAGTPALNVETDATNPNNFYAQQWGVGRVAVLLKSPDTTTGRINDTAGTAQYFHGRLGAVAGSTAPLSLQAGATKDNTTAVTPAVELGYSRYDLAGTTVDAFKTLLTGTIFPANSNWWDGSHMGFRFAAFPSPNKPLTSAGAARTVPWLLGGCSNFIVEYAGDFLHQVPATGAVDGDYSTPLMGTDGEIDYLINARGEKRIRWYGFPRDVAGVTAATAGQQDNAITAQATPGTLPSSPDVLPLRDFLSATAKILTPGLSTAPACAPFEHFVSNALPSVNYMNPALNAEYVCAWQPDGTYRDRTNVVSTLSPPRPRMIRITMTIDDPNGRLPAGQTYEYVMNLP